ncbi:septum formation initiator family protein [Croceicoccus sp. YJ47]|uniref:FtsB family cell division protein n=1 Tax=Croceicoccus sp. YJ47 TaxID=2798724 RepID=UPI0035304395
MPAKRSKPHDIRVTRPRVRRRNMGRVTAAITVGVLCATALVGPTGVRAWGDSTQLLQQREAELAQLQAERDRVANRVQLLDPNNADPDLVGELLRRNLNVAHPDEVVIPRD